MPTDPPPAHRQLGNLAAFPPTSPPFVRRKGSTARSRPEEADGMPAVDLMNRQCPFGGIK